MKFFYVPANGSIVPSFIDEAVERQDGSFVGRWSGETIEVMRKRYPTVEIDDHEVIEKQREDMHRSEPEPCTEEQFMEALECLPPLGWITSGGFESFKMSEFFSGRMTNIYVRTPENQFYSFMDIFTLQHHEIVLRVKSSKNFGKLPQPEVQVTP
jgi:hypothetical protein